MHRRFAVILRIDGKSGARPYGTVSRRSPAAVRIAVGRVRQNSVWSFGMLRFRWSEPRDMEETLR